MSFDGWCRCNSEGREGCWSSHRQSRMCTSRQHWGRMMKNIAEMQLSRVVYMCWRFWAILHGNGQIQEIQWPVCYRNASILRWAVVHADRANYGLKSPCHTGTLHHSNVILFRTLWEFVFPENTKERKTTASTCSQSLILSPANSSYTMQVIVFGLYKTMWFITD